MFLCERRQRCSHVYCRARWFYGAAELALPVDYTVVARL